MSTSADRRPSLVSYSAQFLADVAAVDESFAYAATKFDALIDRPLKNSSTLKVKRGTEVFMDPSAPFKRRVELTMNATSVEVATAPEEMLRLFIDLGMKLGDDLNIRVMAARRDESVSLRSYAEKVYSVTLMPTTYRPDLLGVHFNYAKQWWFLKSGTSLDQETPADLWSGDKRLYDVARVYHLLREGMVYGSHDEGTHAAETVYDHKPHPFLAAIHRGTADWITSLIDSRIAK